MGEQFISEAIKPVAGTFDTSTMASGAPGLPQQFVWRGKTYEVASSRTWHQTGPCTHGSDETYVKKHWFEVTTTSNETMRIYFDRQPRTGRKGSRWWLFSVVSD